MITAPVVGLIICLATGYPSTIGEVDATVGLEGVLAHEEKMAAEAAMIGVRHVFLVIM